MIADNLSNRLAAITATEAIVKPHWMGFTLTPEILWDAVHQGGMLEIWSREELADWAEMMMATYEETKRLRDAVAPSPSSSPSPLP
jgi:hypothetical protein